MSDDAIAALSKNYKISEVISNKAISNVHRVFFNNNLDRWITGLEKIIECKIGNNSLMNYAIGSVKVANSVGFDLAELCIHHFTLIAKKGGPVVANQFLIAMGKAAECISDQIGFKIWLKTIEELVNLNFNTIMIEAVLRQTDKMLAILNPIEFRSWALNGIKLKQVNQSEFETYFINPEIDTLKNFLEPIQGATFNELGRNLHSYLIALWNIYPVISQYQLNHEANGTRRSSFDRMMVSVPRSYLGITGNDAILNYQAAIAHIGAHYRFSPLPLPIGELKPIQLILIGIMEDARVEQLAIREFPGLKRLWLKYHRSIDNDFVTAEDMLACLSRSLIDDDFKSNNPWVEKGRAMFFDQKHTWDNYDISKYIGSLLGNDLGQMRIQINLKNYLISPAYRDDNWGLWERVYEETQSEKDEILPESVRLKQKESPDEHKGKKEKSATDKPDGLFLTKPIELYNKGFQIARHDEWDYISGIARKNWTTISEFIPEPSPVDDINFLLKKYSSIETRIDKLVKAAKISRPVRLRHQRQGDHLDIDACVLAIVEKRAGITPDERIFETKEMVSRDLSVLLLLDISESTRDKVRDTSSTVIAMVRASAAMLAKAMVKLGDPFAIYGFCSNGRDEVRYYRVKNFSEKYSSSTLARLAGLRGMLSTRLGAALRQSGLEIEKSKTHRKLIIVITDGEPSDIDVSDEKYLIQDAKKSIQELSLKGINTFCIGLDSGLDDNLSLIFGTKNFIRINKIESLPEKLAMLYFRLIR